MSAGDRAGSVAGAGDRRGGVSERTVAKWLGRYRAEGETGLADRSSAPGKVANRTADERIELLASLRRLRMTAAEISEVLDDPNARWWDFESSILPFTDVEPDRRDVAKLV